MDKIIAGLQAALQMAAAASDILARVRAGNLSEEDAQREWDRTRDQFRAGADAWDRAGE